MKKIVCKILILFAMCLALVCCASCTGNSYDGVANAYFNAFKKFDYRKMYELIDPNAQSRADYEQFVDYHKKVYDLMHVESVSVTRGEKTDNGSSISYDYTAEFSTSDYGTVSYEMTLEVCKKANFYLVSWTPANVIPKMNWNDKVYASTLSGSRGEIFDRYGRLVVKNDYAVTICALKEDITDIKGTSQKIASILGMDYGDVLNRFTSTRGDTGIFACVFKDNFSTEQQDQISQIEKIRIDKNTITPIRYYPYGNALAQTLGYSTPVTEEDRKEEKFRYVSDSVRVGRSGLEYAFDEYLQPEPGKQVFVTSDQGTNKRVLFEKPARDGYDLILTVDIAIQKNITDNMTELLASEATGTANIVNPKTGAVVALVSYPSYDANVYAYDKATNYGDLFENKATPMLNRNISGTYPPGSIFKSIMALIGLDTGTVTTETVFPYENEIEYYTPQKDRWRPKGSKWSNYIIRQSFPNAGNKGILNMHRGLMWSDNIYFGWLAMMVGKEKMITYAEKLGIGENIPFELKTKKTQLANSFDTLNSQKLLADTGFGQAEMLFTPLQLCCTWSLYGNSGTIMQPYIVQNICTTNDKGEHEVVQTTEPKTFKENIFPESTVLTAREILMGTAKSGTGKSGTLGLWDTMTFCAKTGTAQVSTNKSGEIGWYAGIVLSGGEQDAVLVSSDISDYKFAVVKNIFKQLRYEE